VELIAALEVQAQRHDLLHGDRRVVWRRFGSGEPLVLIHGGHGNWRHWARNIPAWSRHWSVWIPDLPGYGDSDDAAQPTLHYVAQAVSATLDPLVGSTTPVMLAGFSFGALVAAQLAHLRGHVPRMVLLGPAGHGGPRRPRGELRPWRDLAEGSAARVHAMRHNLLMHMLHDAHAVDDLAVQIHENGCSRTRLRSKHISRSAALRPSLESYPGALLVLWGEHDVTVDPAHALPDLPMGGQRRLEWVSGAGHWVQYEAAPEINERVRHWLSQN
jgi:pimeloyl-ACP methyl ester carboxylesterase